jgi:hypothetical protein
MIINEFDIVQGLVIELDLVDNTIIQTNLFEGPTMQFDLVCNPIFSIEYETGGLGPQGPPGPAGGSVVVVTAGENLSTGRVVIMDGGVAVYFQPSNVNHAGRAYGVTTSSAIFGSDVNVQVIGDVTDAAFTFAVDRLLWVGNDGEILDTLPAFAVLQKAGISTLFNKMKIDFSQQIIL